MRQGSEGLQNAGPCQLKSQPPMAKIYYSWQDKEDKIGGAHISQKVAELRRVTKLEGMSDLSKTTNVKIEASLRTSASAGVTVKWSNKSRISEWPHVEER